MSSPIRLLVLLFLVGYSSGAPSSAQNQTRIAGGSQSAQHGWPFFAGIFYGGAFIPHCGGVVWDQDTILTAANCILSKPSTEPNKFEVYLGHNEFIMQKNQAYMYKAKEIITHPDYHSGSFSDDIALIRLERSINFDGDNKVECVCDPEPLCLLDTTKCFSMGWGLDAQNILPSTLLEVVLPMMDVRTCVKLNKDFDPSSHLCAGSVGASVCAADSGGPLVCPRKDDPSKYSLVGLAGFFVPPCGQNPSFFCRVEYYLDWIDQQSPNHYVVV